jgi:hypothetical protein
MNFVEMRCRELAELSKPGKSTQTIVIRTKKEIVMIRKIIVLAMAAFSFGIISCASSPFKIIFPEGAERSDFTQMPISERLTFGVRDERIQIGSYTASVDRSWTKTKSTDDFVLFGSSETKTATQTYKFALTGPDGFSWAGKCAAGAELEKDKVKLFKFTSNSEEMKKNTLAGEFVSGDKKILLYIYGETYEKTGSITSGEISLSVNYSSRSQRGGFGNSTSHFDIYKDNVLIAVIGPSAMDKALYVRKGTDPNLMPVLLNATIALVAYEDMGAKVKDQKK